MENKNRKSFPIKWLVVLLVVLLVAAVAFVAGKQMTDAHSAAADEGQLASDPEDEGDVMEEAQSLPLATKHIILTYPAELEGDVTVSYEEMNDGQKVTFTTNIAGEELELFHFSITTSGDDGYFLGTLEDKKAGSLMVYTHVPEYENGSWKPEDYNKISSMQERVNDIIVQFYEDARFVPNR